jgi:hypothetical protein
MRCALLEGIVNPVLVVVFRVIPNQPPEMFFMQWNDMVEDLSAAASDPFCHGDCTFVRFGFRPVLG